MKPETRFAVNQVDPFLKKLQHCVVTTVQQLAKCGDPDRILCIRGRYVALELKALDGKARPLQEWKLTSIRVRGGGLAFVVSPDNWEEIKIILSKLDRGEEP